MRAGITTLHPAIRRSAKHWAAKHWAVKHRAGKHRAKRQPKLSATQTPAADLADAAVDAADAVSPSRNSIPATIPAMPPDRRRHSRKKKRTARLQVISRLFCRAKVSPSTATGRQRRPRIVQRDIFRQNLHQQKLHGKRRAEVPRGQLTRHRNTKHTTTKRLRSRSRY